MRAEHIKAPLDTVVVPLAGAGHAVFLMRLAYWGSGALRWPHPSQTPTWC